MSVHTGKGYQWARGRPAAAAILPSYPGPGTHAWNDLIVTPHRPSSPVFLDLLRIRLPAMAWASLLHRVSGVLLFLATPAAIALLDRALTGADGFARVAAMLREPPAMAAVALVVWALVHHLLAGVRFLLLDLEFGLSRAQGRRSAVAVMVVAPLVTALLLWRVWT